MRFTISVNNYRKILLIICITSIVGCAGQEAARKVAALTAESTNGLKLETSKFFEEANNLAQKNEVRIQRLNEQSLAIRVDSDIATSGWKIANDKRASAMFSAMSNVKVNQIVGQSIALTLLQPAPDVAKITFDLAQYDDLVKRLNELAEQPSFTDTVSAYIEFGKKVNDQLNSDSNGAGDSLLGTNASSDSNDESLTIN